MPEHYARAAIQDDLMQAWNTLFAEKTSLYAGISANHAIEIALPQPQSEHGGKSPLTGSGPLPRVDDPFSTSIPDGSRW